MYGIKHVKHDFSKIIVRPCEELKFNKNKKGLGYGRYLKFHILDYSKPIEWERWGAYVINQEIL